MSSGPPKKRLTQSILSFKSSLKEVAENKGIVRSDFIIAVLVLQSVYCVGVFPGQTVRPILRAFYAHIEIDR